jgi:hypothetical protein
MGRPPQLKAPSPGDRFGRWKVVGDELPGGARKARTIPCECDCGTMKTVSIHDLMNGKSKACGRCNQPGKPRRRRIATPCIGDRFGKWTVVGDEIPGKLGKARTVPCACDCGKKRSVAVDTLVKGRSTCCGCIPKVKATYPRIGDRYGGWEVIGEAQTRVLCRCDCGVEKHVRVDGLKSGRSATCGTCNRSMDRFKSVLGCRYGHLTVTKEHQIRRNRRVICRCDCGNEHEYFLMNLKRGQIKSCGCVKHYDHTHGRVYYLLDPTTEAVRYVGQTVQQIDVRLNAHIYKGSTDQQRRTNAAKRQWIESLRPSRPIIVVAEDAIPVAKLDSREQHHIALQSAKGADLLNIQHARSR